MYIEEISKQHLLKTITLTDEEFAYTVILNRGLLRKGK